MCCVEEEEEEMMGEDEQEVKAVVAVCDDDIGIVALLEAANAVSAEMAETSPVTAPIFQFTQAPSAPESSPYSSATPRLAACM